MIGCDSASFSIVRSFDAPVDVVFRVFTDADFISQWWGCDGSTVTIHSLDVRTGGDYHIDVLLSDGSVHSSRGTYVEVLRNRRIVSNDDTATHTLTFVEHDGRTTVTLLVAFTSRALFEHAIDSGVRGGIAHSWDTIERILQDVK